MLEKEEEDEELFFVLLPAVMPFLDEEKTPEHTSSLPCAKKLKEILFTLKLGRRARELAGFQNYANQGVDGVKVEICWIECNTGSILSE